MRLGVRWQKRQSKSEKRKERREGATCRRETVDFTRIAIVPSERYSALGMERSYAFIGDILSPVSPAHGIRLTPARELEKGDQRCWVVL